MTATSSKNLAKLIHIAKIYPSKGDPLYLFLRKESPTLYIWFLENHDKTETQTSIIANNPEEAVRLAKKEWKSQEFALMECGFRYTLAERDEHGMNALFHQMAASYDSMNGVYFDEDLGNNCFVQAAPPLSQKVWRQLKNEGRL